MAKITIIAQGAMGSGVGRRLVERGHAVATVLEGRSAASTARAEAAGMKPVALSQAAECDLFLSILPPAEAVTLAQKMLPALKQAARKPIYVDCNAISPDTMKEVAAALSPSGAQVVDAGIIGGPPKTGYTPQVYVSGPAAPVIAIIGDALDMRPLEGPVGAASAMKMCYAGLSKGFQALGAAMLGAAVKAGAGEALLAQLAESQPDFLRYLTKQVPAAFPKAYRFVGEMEEISAFLQSGGDAGGAQIYAGMAKLFERLAQDVEGPKTETGALIRLVK